jgi:ubiquinone biosynthesis protein
LATASIAQVHCATVRDSGERVVLKVQRPNIAAQIRADLSILKLILERTLSEFPELELFDPRGIFLEFEKSITAELDFFQEVRNLQRFRKNFTNIEGVKWPTPYEEWSSSRVMCMEYLQGVKIRLARESGADMAVVGQRYLRVAYAMLFEHGFFHGDLHPGNVLVLEDNVIGVIDCGMVGRLTDEMKNYLASLIYALHRGDSRTVARLFFDISIKEKRVDYLSFERDAIETADRHWSGGSFEEMNIGSFLMDLTRGALRYRVHAPPAFTMFFKGVMTTEGLAKSLLPEVDPLGAAQPYVERLIKERWQPERWSDLGIQNIAAYGGIAKRLPISITQFLDDLDAQRFRIQVESHSSLEQTTIQRNIENTRVLLFFAGLWAVMSIAGLYFVPATVFNIPVLFVLFGVISIGFQGWVLWRLWRSR